MSDAEERKNRGAVGEEKEPRDSGIEERRRERERHVQSRSVQAANLRSKSRSTAMTFAASISRAGLLMVCGTRPLAAAAAAAWALGPAGAAAAAAPAADADATSAFPAVLELVVLGPGSDGVG
jgi:hypothetical protein